MMWVQWKEDALDELADIYVAADPADRDNIEQTVEQINAALAADPFILGESRASVNLKSLVIGPAYGHVSNLDSHQDRRCLSRRVSATMMGYTY